jgi:hypothetical protein
MPVVTVADPARRRGQRTQDEVNAARADGGALSAQDRAQIAAAVLALDPMDDEQITAVCEVITTSRVRWGAELAA